MSGAKVTNEGKSGVKIEKKDGMEVKTMEKHVPAEKSEDGSQNSAEVHIKKVEIKKGA